MKYNFRDNYGTFLGENPEKRGYKINFISSLKESNKGDGSRANPYSSKYLDNNTYSNVNGTMVNVFSSGYHFGTLITRLINTGSSGGGWMQNGILASCEYIGQGRDKTVLDLDVYAGFNNVNSFVIRDCEVRRFMASTTSRAAYHRYYNCDIYSNITQLGNPSISNGCRIFAVCASSWSSQNSHVGYELNLDVALPMYFSAGNVFDRMDLFFSKTFIENNAYLSNRWIFNDCNIMIGTELSFTPLAGDTIQEQKADFVRRARAQGIIIRQGTENGVTEDLYRWCFSKNSCVDGLVIKDSQANVWENIKNIKLGYSTVRGEQIPMTPTSNVPKSITYDSGSNNITINEGNITFRSDVDITTKVTGNLVSKIIPFNGRRRLYTINIIHNFLQSLGFSIDDQQILSSTPTTTIEVGKSYILRSNNDNEAIITYNGKTYSSDLSQRAVKEYILEGVEGETAFIDTTGNSQLFEILDELSWKFIDIRLVDQIPTEQIKTGNLIANYWYLVEHDSDPNNDTDYITYNGVNYKNGDSFIVQTGTLTFTTNGDIHLRRCWNKDYDNPNTETVDKAFWENILKPKWMPFNPSDFRCLMYRNNDLETEMLRDNYTSGENFNYYSSGHPDFYDKLLPISGIITPTYYPKGAYMQIKFNISTLNPM